MSDHGLCNCHIVVDLSVVDLKLQADEVGQDCGTAGHGLDRRCALAGFGPHDWEAAEKNGSVKSSKSKRPQEHWQM